MIDRAVLPRRTGHRNHSPHSGYFGRRNRQLVIHCVSLNAYRDFPGAEAVIKIVIYGHIVFCVIARPFFKSVKCRFAVEYGSGNIIVVIILPVLQKQAVKYAEAASVNSNLRQTDIHIAALQGGYKLIKLLPCFRN